MAKPNGKASGNKVEPDASKIPAVDLANPIGAPSTEKLGDQPVDRGAIEQPVGMASEADAASTVVDATASIPAPDAPPNNPAAASTEAPSPDEMDPEGAVDTPAKAIESEPALWIRSVKPEGFRRCGFRFDRDGVGIAVSALTDEQIETLSTEANLVVEPTWFPASELI